MHEHPVTEAGKECTAQIWAALGGPDHLLARLEHRGDGALPSVFAVSDLAAGAIGAAGLALADFAALAFGRMGQVAVDHRLASLWFSTSLRPAGWELPPAWDAVAGDYPTRDGWIRLHTNAPHHRAVALQVLGTAADRAEVAKAVAGWDSEALETTVMANGGCAAAMRNLVEWDRHPQGLAVAAEPLVSHRLLPVVTTASWSPRDQARPLAGIRVLDLTRVLAGPVATRFLASAGADVLRIDPPGWDEPGVLPEVTVGKHRARLDLKSADGIDRLKSLLGEADILVHGYRPGALDALGLDEDARQAIRPGLIDVSLCAYGWSGPWAGRRGFDSLVQMSSGIAAEGMRQAGADKPKPLPVQALDHAAGYILAAAALRGLSLRLDTGRGSSWRTSLARVARLLVDLGRQTANPEAIGDIRPMDYAAAVEQTGWGPAHRLRQPLTLSGMDLHWTVPAGPLGSHAPQWR